MNRRTVLSGGLACLGCPPAWTIGGTLAGMLGTMAAADAARPLAEWRWKARLLLVFAPDDADPDLQTQRRMLAEAQAGVAAHDLVAIEIVGHRVASEAVPPDGAGPDAASLRRDYRVPLPRFCVILIGKDGGEKLRQTRPISARSVFATIERMPMGRDEAHRRSQPDQPGAGRP